MRFKDSGLALIHCFLFSLYFLIEKDFFPAIKKLARANGAEAEALVDEGNFQDITGTTLLMVELLSQQT